MARIQYGSVITDIKGSIGGITFQANAANKIARIKPTRRKQNSIKQNTRITAFQQELSPWATFSTAEKDAWNTFAAAHTKTNKWGEVKTLTGFNWFMSINNNLALIGQSPLSAPPVWTPPKAVNNYTVAAVSDDFSINFAPAFSHPNNCLLLFTSPLLRTVSEANRKTLRLTKITAVATTSTIDFLAEWQSTHGISVPISGNPNAKFIFTAIMAINHAKGIAGVFNTNQGEYETA